MKKLILTIIITLSTFLVAFTQNINNSTGNITGYNRIQTGSGGWLDIQLLGSGSTFQIHDNTNNSKWVRWSAGSAYTDFLKSVYISGGNLGIGTNNTGHKLNILHESTSYESIIKASVADAPSDYFTLSNGTGNAGQFIPYLKGYHASDNRPSLIMTGMTNTGNDNGNNSLVTFGARLDNGPIINRPLFAWTNYNLTKMIMGANGNLGIGTTSLGSKLNVTHQATTYESLARFSIDDKSDDLVIVNVTGTGGQFIPQLKATHTSDNRQAIYVTGKTNAANDNGNNPLVAFSTGLENGPVVNRPLFEWTNYGSQKMIISANGNVGIGTDTPQSKLAVEGTIRSKEVVVKANIDVPDYVFASDYKLRSLRETQEYITQNQHLPEIPSAKEIEANGIELGVMNLKLLKKIEELTLYQLELLDKIENMENMKSEFNQLKEQVKLLVAQKR